MLAKKLSDVNFNDISDLITNEVPEGKTLEYKSELAISSRDEKKEFLADITSFANTDGGDIIYGVKEDAETKLPSELVGISLKNEDDLIRQIESILRDGVSPRIPEIEFKVLLISEEKYILIIRIGISYSLPHRVIFSGYDRFYSRNSKGKYPMDVDELRSSFTMSQALYSEIDKYVEENLTIIAQNKNKDLIENLPILSLQFIPISSFRRSKILYSIKEVNRCVNARYNLANDMFFILSHYLAQRITIDGIIAAHKNQNHGDNNSLKIHYKVNGVVEITTTSLFFRELKNQNRNPSEPYDVVSSKDMVEQCIAATNKIKAYYNELGVSTPILLYCSIINGRGFSLPRGFGYNFPKCAIDRDIINIPSVYINDFNQETSQILKPMFDMMWNAFGRSHCTAYNQATSEYTGFLNEDECAL